MRRYDSDGDDCAAALRLRDDPTITLSGFDANQVFDALLAASAALREAEGSKLRGIREPARRAREKVDAAWARVDRARLDAVRPSGKGTP